MKKSNKSSSKPQIVYRNYIYPPNQPQAKKDKAKTIQKNQYNINTKNNEMKKPYTNQNFLNFVNINLMGDMARTNLNNKNINSIKAKNVNINNNNIYNNNIKDIKMTNINKKRINENIYNKGINIMKDQNAYIKNNNKIQNINRPNINIKVINIMNAQNAYIKNNNKNQNINRPNINIKGINDTKVKKRNIIQEKNIYAKNEVYNNKLKRDEGVSDKNNIINEKTFPRGLNNIGATCYMNSVLQSFYHVYDLSNELIKLKNIDERKMPMTSAYLEVINELTFNKENSISPIKFKIMISNNELFEGIGANDAKSLTLYILETLNEEFNGNNLKINNEKILNKIRNLKNKEMENIVKDFNSNYNSIIAELFYGLKMTTYRCLTCNDCPADYQLFNIINLSIEQTFVEMKKKELKVDILECLKVEQKPKYFNGDNQLFCDKCNKMVDGESVNRIYIAPKIMILFLDRGFNNSFRCEVTFPEKFNMREFADIDGGEYHLIGVIEHLGPSSNSGHFIAICKHFDGNWYLFSDSTIIGPNKNYKKEGEPYLLFYRRN